MSMLYIITGPAGVGKTTVSELVAGSLDKSILIEGDMIYHQVIGGYKAPWEDGNHLDMFWDASIELIDVYLKNGYDVVFDYVVDVEDLKRIKERFHDYNKKFVILISDEDTLIKRDRRRDISNQMKERCKILLRDFINKNFDDKYYLDTSNMDIDEISKEILNKSQFDVL